MTPQDQERINQIAENCSFEISQFLWHKLSIHGVAIEIRGITHKHFGKALSQIEMERDQLRAELEATKAELKKLREASSL